MNSEFKEGNTITTSIGKKIFFGKYEFLAVEVLFHFIRQICHITISKENRPGEFSERFVRYYTGRNNLLTTGFAQVKIRTAFLSGRNERGV